MPNLILFELWQISNKSYIGILIPSVRCDYMNQVARYRCSVPHHPIFSGIGRHAPPPPSPRGNATEKGFEFDWQLGREAEVNRLRRLALKSGIDGHQ